MTPAPRDVLATICFAIATIQALSAVPLKSALEKLKVPAPFFELETIYIGWAIVFLGLGLFFDYRASFADAADLNFRGALTVMVLIGFFFSQRTIAVVDLFFDLGSRVVRNSLVFLTRSPEKFSAPRVHFAFLLIVGPLLGSLISEPAAMVVTAVVLKQRYFRRPVSQKFRYLVFAVLFVNVSIGGALTSFAAPAIVAVASKWGWSSLYMLEFFGWKCVEAVVVSTIWLTVQFASEIQNHTIDLQIPAEIDRWAGWSSGLRLAGFLLALQVLMSHQAWWIGSLLKGTSGTGLYPGAMLLTSILDNAVITSLGSQAALGPSERYYLVAGSLVGGGLTLLANAPNIVGFRILQHSGDGRWSHKAFLKAALIPTLIAALALLVY